MKKRFLSILLSLCMVLALFPATAFAEDNEEPAKTVTPTTVAKDITLGYSALHDADTENAKWDYVYYGTYGGEPIKWRILSMNGNDGTYKDSNDETVSSENAMFLLSEYALKQMAYNKNGTKNNGQTYASDWRYSDAWYWCNDTTDNASFIGSSFNDSEKAYFLKTSKANSNTDEYPDGLNGDTFFFLSYYEAANFQSNSNRIASLNGNTVGWWLRSPEDYEVVSYVGDNGNLDETTNVTDDAPAARPALNLNLSSVLFTSAAEGSKSGAVGEISTISDYTGKEWKLTMKDESRKNFTVTEKSAKGCKGETISFTYDEAVTGSTEYISAIIVQNGMVLYYGKLANATSAGGSVPFTIPSDIDYGTYDLCIFNEQINGDKKTDFSSDFQKVTLTVNKADQSVPTGLSGTAETIDGKADGKITGVTTAMEYRKEGDTDYTAITGTEITGLAAGKYYVRYKANHNYNASDDTEITVATGRKLTVTVPTTQVGYTLLVNKTELVWKDSVELTFALANGYSKLDTFAVNVNGNPVTLDANGKYTVTDVQSDITITVAGVAEIFTITFDPNGGTVDPTSATTDAYGKLTELPTPTRSGSYRFDGWFTEKNGGTAVTVDTVFTAHTTVYAHWTYTGSTTPDYCVIKATAGEGGSITPSGRAAVLYGASKTFTITPNDGYAIADVKVDGNSVGAVKTYTFERVRGDHTIEAVFMKATGNPQTGVDIPFTDVSENDWFYEDVAYVYANDLMKGTSETTFSPAVTTTRGMIVTILYRLEGEPTVSDTCPFEDVKSGSYYEKAITWAAANEIVSGYGNGKFGPDDAITREQMAVILYRYTQYKGMDVSVGEDTNILSYNDAQEISEYAFSAMQWACGESILNGSDGNLMPQGNATRAQVAAILHRFCENILK